MPPASGVGPTRRPGAKRGGRLQVEGSRSRTEAGGTWRCRPRCLQVCPRGEMAVPTNGRRHRVPAAPRPPAVPGCRRAALLQVAGPSHRRHDLGLLSRLWRFCLGSCSCSRSMRTRLPHHRLLPCVSLARPWPSAPMEPRWLSPVFVLTRNRDLQGSLPFHLLCPSVFAGVRSWLNQAVVTHPPPAPGWFHVPPPQAASPWADAGVQKHGVIGNAAGGRGAACGRCRRRVPALGGGNGLLPARAARRARGHTCRQHRHVLPASARGRGCAKSKRRGEPGGCCHLGAHPPSPPGVSRYPREQSTPRMGADVLGSSGFAPRRC